MYKITLFTKPVFVPGFSYSGIHCGIKKQTDLRDLGLIYCPSSVASAGVFTQNVAKAAPVTLSQTHLHESTSKAILINSGNANACTGDQGKKDAQASVHLVADQLKIDKSEVLLASTGIIGVPLPMPTMRKGITSACSNLDERNILNLAKSILTTDTYTKVVSATITKGTEKLNICGIAKGSGMIHPNMATMLGFIMTDADVDSTYLQNSLETVTDESFNMISVDGDTSTNDMVLALASGQSKLDLKNDTAASNAFKKALLLVCTELSKLIARDGEGATKLLEIQVMGAESHHSARLASKAVASSSLVKAAFFGKDANWGRILCAIGYSGAKFPPENIDLHIETEYGLLPLMKEGTPLTFDDEYAESILSAENINVLVNLNDGPFSATAWGCDLTYDYVKINGEYRS